jgi:hypothetical protein
MNNDVLKWALQEGRLLKGLETQHAVERLLRVEAECFEASAALLRAIAADSADAEFAASMPGPRPLTRAQVRDLWDGVNDSGKRILGCFVVHGGQVSVDDLMKVVGVEEPRLLNGPLGGISRRVKKLADWPEATFYSIDPETNLYVLPAETTTALMALVEERRPEWLGGLTAPTENGETNNV